MIEGCGNLTRFLIVLYILLGPSFGCRLNGRVTYQEVQQGL